MNNNFVINALKSAFTMEIANNFSTTDDAIIIDFPNQTKAIIKAPKIDKVDNQPINNTNKAEHTYHYLHRNDFEFSTDPEVIEKFEMLSIEDCRSYLDDACQTFFDAKFNDFELTFATGDVYLVMIEQC